MKMMTARFLALAMVLPVAAGEVEGEPDGAEAKCAAVFVSVGDAMPMSMLGEIASRVSSSLDVRIGTNATGKTTLSKLVDDTAPDPKPAVGKPAVAVFFRNSPGAPAVVASPRRWAIVNIAPLSADNPAPPLLGERMAKVALRGLAYASGSGATMDAHCLMSPACDTLKGLDAAPFAISPMAYIPMLEFLSPAD